MRSTQYKASSKIAVVACTLILMVDAECGDDCRNELPETTLLQVDLSRQSSNPAVVTSTDADNKHRYSPNPRFEWSPTLQSYPPGSPIPQSIQGGDLSNEQIPRILTMMGPQEAWAYSFGGLPDVLRQNIIKTRDLNNDLSFRYMGDASCLVYMQQHFDVELVQMFVSEKAGRLRGDICRAAVLFQEGGFYADADLDMSVPFTELVEDASGPLQFMSALDASGMVYNAIIGVVPKSPVMKNHLEEIRQWYRNHEGDHIDIKNVQQDPLESSKRIEFDPMSSEWTSGFGDLKKSWDAVEKISPASLYASIYSTHSANMGTITLKRALDSYIQEMCSGFNLDSWRDDPTAKEVRWRCGPNKFILYREKDCEKAFSPKCSVERSGSHDHQMKFGIVGDGKHDKFIAWSRVFQDDRSA